MEASNTFRPPPPKDNLLKLIERAKELKTENKALREQVDCLKKLIFVGGTLACIGIGTLALRISYSRLPDEIVACPDWIFTCYLLKFDYL